MLSVELNGIRLWMKSWCPFLLNPIYLLFCCQSFPNALSYYCLHCKLGKCQKLIYLMLNILHLRMAKENYLTKLLDTTWHWQCDNNTRNTAKVFVYLCWSFHSLWIRVQDIWHEIMDYITTLFYVLFLIITLFKNYASLPIYFQNKTLNAT